MIYDPRWAEKGSMEFKNRDNPKMIGHTVGTVVEINPVKVSVLDGQAFFSGEKLRIGEKLEGYTETVIMSINGGESVTAIMTHPGIKVGDKLICEFTQNNQELIVIDKVGGD